MPPHNRLHRQQAHQSNPHRDRHYRHDQTHYQQHRTSSNHTYHTYNSHEREFHDCIRVLGSEGVELARADGGGC